MSDARIPTSASFAADAALVAAQLVRSRLGDITPDLAIVLGSGLGGLARRIERARRIEFADVPGFAATSVVGHEGALIAGQLAGRPVVALAGRFHLYEGHDPALSGFPIRVLHALGARTLFVSNAAGGIRRTFRPGDLMIIADHLNLTWRNPLIGRQEPTDDRFPDMSEPYDAALTARLADCARDCGVAVQSGVYAWLTGPTYETPAEVRMLDRLGADAVGMSTVPEVLVARALGMRVAGMSLISNMASGLSLSPITHAEVMEAGREAATRFEAIVTQFTKHL